MSFDYDSQTRKHYMDAQVASAYHAQFNEGGGLAGFRSRVVAKRERAGVRQLLAHLDVRHVLDLPAGTGKMGVVYKDMGVRVTAADVSGAMLDIARKVYAELQYADVTFAQCDAENATSLASDGRFDVVVCLRLMHRVPAEVRERMLAEFAVVAPWLVISYGIDSWFHRLRRPLRRFLFRNKDVGVSTFPTMDGAMRELGRFYRIVNVKPVFTGLSGEYLFLLARRP